MKRIRVSLGQISIWLLFVSFSGLLSCQRSLDPQVSQNAARARVRVNQTITEIVVGNPNFSLLRTAVVRAGLAEALSTGNLTVFAPTNAAFQAAGFADENAVNNADLNTLKGILLYHVIGSGRFFSDQVPEQLTAFGTLHSEPLQLLRDPTGSVAVNGRIVSQADLEANNGVIHVIDDILLPPPGNTIEAVTRNADLTFLAAALVRVNSTTEFDILGELLRGTNTVFAPTNAAFQAAGFANIAAIQAADLSVLRRILLYHVVQSRFFTPQFNVGELTTLEGGKLATIQSGNQVTVQGNGNMQSIPIQTKNINTLNGVVHIINQVLLPGDAIASKTVTELVVASPDLSLLRAAVVRTGLAEALATGNLTVFAPTNAAFQAAGFADENAINNADVNVLRRILLYHVIGMDRYFTNIIPERLVGLSTLQGEQVYVVREQRGIFVNGISVIQTNVKATNGVIHLINRVLLPPGGNTVEVAVANPNLTFLVAAVQRAGLVQTLATGRFTVFAPTNAAFQAAGFPNIAAIQSADPATLARILTYHVITERNFAANLRTDNLQTVQGGPVFVTASAAGVTLKGNANTSASRVVAADVVTLNGVVHVIDQVLLP
jgi:transforming growth factor-beta-induced protein